VVLPPTAAAMSSGPRFASNRTPAAAIDAPKSGGIYYVEAGDTLLSIAAGLGVDPDALASLNKIGDGDIIPLGRALDIPTWGPRQTSNDGLVRAASLGSGAPTNPQIATKAPTPVVYEVAEGDTISTLADR